MEQAGVPEDEAKQALKDANGDLAEAIMTLSS
jgi:NACalpha-BTF3-like transcription factor